MTEARWDRRFFSTTRGQIVRLLRRAGRTVEELAQALSLTDNAVRSHLSTLERDGLVEQLGTRRTERKPAYVYGLTAGAERLFPRAYEPVLGKLLDVLGERLPGDALESALREVGRRLGAERTGTSAPDVRARTRLAAGVLEELGGLIEIEEDEGAGTLRLRGFGCPLAAVAPGHPDACRLAETLLEEIIGAPVRERCDRATERPRCYFEVLAG